MKSGNMQNQGQPYSYKWKRPIQNADFSGVRNVGATWVATIRSNVHPWHQQRSSAGMTRREQLQSRLGVLRN
ncbi:hypothetical protein Ancab_018589, partial [Ancistrocladus abbreviatus]